MRSADQLPLPCPICGRATPISNARFLPFCSDRCRLIDLGRWLDEEHSIPCSSADDEEPNEKFDDDSQEPGQQQRRPPSRLPPGWHDA